MNRIFPGTSLPGCSAAQASATSTLVVVDRGATLGILVEYIRAGQIPAGPSRARIQNSPTRWNDKPGGMVQQRNRDPMMIMSHSIRWSI